MKIFLIIWLVIWGFITINAQPPICGNNPEMTPFCKEACIICDIDGFTGRNNSNVTGQAPPGFCTSFVHHMQWIGFVAGTTDLELDITVFNCVRNEGLEIGLYESTDCNTFRRVSECDTDIKENQVRVFVNTVPLVIGQYYYLVMDGSDNDICDYSVKVKKGSTKVLPLENAPQLICSTIVCQNEVFNISTPGLQGATFYNWTIDGVFLNNSTSFTHTLDKPGKYTLCLNASNVCDVAPQSCKTIEVLPVSRSSFEQQICFGECFNYEGNKYCNTGQFDVIFPAVNGCDSIVTLDLVVDDRITAKSKLYLCEGDTLSIGNGSFFTEGIHQTVINNKEGCDVFMTIDLKLIICNIKSTETTTPVLCNAQNTGAIHFKVDSGSPPFIYSCFKIENPSINFNGNIEAINQEININGVDAGNYAITIQDTFGNTRIVNVQVDQPPKLTAINVLSNFNQYQISCYGASDGYIKLLTDGGISPYTYSHVGLSYLNDSVYNLIAGVYTSIVKDKNGCTVEIQSVLKEPDSLKIITEFTPPNCEGLNTGIIKVISTSGGIAPYVISLNGGTSSDKTTYSDLKEGSYIVEIEDNNGCTTNIIDSLIAPEIPDIKPIDSLISISLGDSILLGVISNLTDQTIQWNPDAVLACKNCLVTNAQPVNDTKFIISVTSKDGCNRTVSIEVKVEKQRSFVISNIISPNGDNQNDKLKYFAGNDVAEIKYFAIYDRWGELIFHREGFPNGLKEIDWGATFKEIALNPGVLIWIAKVLYIDDVVINYKGSITIIK
ncbi:MAG: gliding motility-associated C-terminal domain-containing protein [Saprospiraceae bacterium]|nr:gliding motility-associated C-terminal domain-containing protein [Saprospiraceae bacterium]